MKRQILTMTAVAMLATTPALGQEMSAIEAGLNTEVYAMGMAELTEDGFVVERVRQEASGELVFRAHTDAMARVLVLDEDGNVLSDTMTELSASGGAKAAAMNHNENSGENVGFGVDAKGDVTAKSDAGENRGGLDLSVNAGAGINLDL